MFYYGVNLVDVMEGRGPHPVVVLALVQRLPDTSLTAALTQGGREYFGWGIDRHLSADVFDAVNLNTKATGQWKKGKVPDFPLWPRPGRGKGKGKGKKAKPKSLADVYQQFIRR